MGPRLCTMSLPQSISLQAWQLLENPLLTAKKSRNQSEHYYCSSRRAALLVPLTHHCSSSQGIPNYNLQYFLDAKEQTKVWNKRSSTWQAAPVLSCSNKVRNKNCFGGCSKVGKAPEKPQWVTWRCNVVFCDLYEVPGEVCSLHSWRFSSPEWIKQGLVL